MILKLVVTASLPSTLYVRGQSGDWMNWIKDNVSEWDGMLTFNGDWLAWIHNNVSEWDGMLNHVSVWDGMLTFEL